MPGSFPKAYQPPMRPVFFPCIGVLLAASLFLLGGAAPALAQRQGVVPLDRLLPEIRRTHPGQFYDADGPSPGPDGSLHYHLKWMTPDGRIEWLDTDARTGRVLGSSPGRDTFDGPPPPAAPDYRGRFRDDTGDAPNDRFYPRGGQDYGNGRNDRDDRERGEGNGRDRDFGGRVRER
jgi:hypothetical protein